MGDFFVFEIIPDMFATSDGTRIEELARISGNDYCADCKFPDPTWASINLGIFICLKCAGAHRSLGVHFKVRSWELDTSCWTPELLHYISQRGNDFVNSLFEHDVPRYFLRPQDEKNSEAIRLNFIQAKYVRLEFITRKYPLESLSLGIQISKLPVFVSRVFAMPEAAKIGFFQKIGANSGKWQKRLFTLTGRYMSYFREDDDSFPVGRIDVTEAKLGFPSESGNYFSLKTKDREYQFLLDSSAQMIDWCHAIRRAKIFYSSFPSFGELKESDTFVSHFDQVSTLRLIYSIVHQVC